LPVAEGTFVAYSGPGTGCGSGAAPGHIGTCVCPGEGCQTLVCACSLQNTNALQRATIKSLMCGQEAILVALVVEAEIRSDPSNRRGPTAR